MDLAILIVSYNVIGLLDRCLFSIFESLDRSSALEAAVWVVDNASSDGSAGLVRERYPQADLFACDDNLGFAAGNNLALRALGFKPAGDEAVGSGRQAARLVPPVSPSTPRYVLLLNPDTEVQGASLARMVAFLDSQPGAGGCGARLSYPDGRFQHGAFRFPGLAQVALDFFPPPGRLNQPLLDSALNGRYSGRLYGAGQPFAVDFVLGATLMLRAEALRQVGLLDEGYFMYCEEMDLQQRLRQAGWPMVCLPSAHVLHHGGASTAQFRGPMLVALWRSRLRYFQRHRGPQFNWLASRLVALGIQAEARRARRQAPPDLAERLDAYQEILQLVRVNR